MFIQSYSFGTTGRTLPRSRISIPYFPTSARITAIRDCIWVDRVCTLIVWPSSAMFANVWHKIPVSDRGPGYIESWSALLANKLSNLIKLDSRPIDVKEGEQNDSDMNLHMFIKSVENIEIANSGCSLASIDD